MNEISYAVFLFFVIFLFAYYYELNPPKSQILTVAAMLGTIFLWHFVSEALAIKTHFYPEQSEYYFLGGIFVYSLAVMAVWKEKFNDSARNRWWLFIGSSLLYAIVMIALVQSEVLYLK